MNNKFICIILFLIPQVVSHVLVNNCINGCKKSYDYEILCCNVINYDGCKINIIINFNICSDICNNYYYTYQECKNYCRLNGIKNDCL